ncbi:hypothetical protein Vadar_011377 [Vaccinium darrowii]|uniref:Uncharacterized protein n=1 Tax=Vaccinium darrowii TaxID=229202 RepID=A0ACB7Z3S6_9ERIC|nr:hypothetical protein Vadar_011377 [Vaccinium darrowii]
MTFDQQRLDLDKPFVEVRTALFQIEGSKATGADGYVAAFYLQNWEVVRKEAEVKRTVPEDEMQVQGAQRTIIFVGRCPHFLQKGGQEALGLLPLKVKILFFDGKTHELGGKQAKEV